jgi:hypothetical protein
VNFLAALFIVVTTMPFHVLCHDKAVGARGAMGALPATLPFFDRSVKPISIVEGRLCPPNSYVPPHPPIFKFFYGPAMKKKWSHSTKHRKLNKMKFKANKTDLRDVGGKKRTPL